LGNGPGISQLTHQTITSVPAGDRP
jgi:hypothetical protein